jgi:hypothetical protein
MRSTVREKLASLCVMALVAASLVVAAGISGCGDDDGDKADTTETTATQPAPAPSPSPTPPATTTPGDAPPTSGPAAEAAQAFVDCLDLPGHNATLLGASGTGAPLASMAKGVGYDVAAVNIATDGSVIGPANVTFFVSESDREKAAKELKSYLDGDDVEPLVQGTAIVDYLTPEDRTKAGEAISACLQ